MDGPRAPSENEFHDVVQFFSQQLRADKAWSIAEEYPLAMTKFNLPNFRIIKDQDQLLSGAVVKTFVVRTHAGLFKVGGIGSVVTAPAHRNQGHSRSVLESSLMAAKEQNCDFAILWTDLYDYYRKVGFEVAGCEIRLRIVNEIPENPHSLRFLNSTKVSPEALLRLYSQHSCGTVRTAEDIRKYLSIPNMRVYTAWDAQNQLLAYAVEGKGADLDGFVHEWGGSTQALVSLLAHIRRTQSRPLTVLAPAHSKNLVRQLELAGAHRTDGILGMIQILNPQHIIGKINRYARSLGLDQLVLDYRDGVYFFGQGDQIFKSDLGADLVRLVFGPQRASQIHDFDPETARVLESIFPIPMWVWGWDSV